MRGTSESRNSCVRISSFTNGFVIATRPVGDVIFVKTAAYPK